MKIGIDAKWYFTGPVSTRTILHNLLPELFRLYPQHEWILFLDKKDKEKPFPLQQGNVIIEYVWADNNMLSSVYILPRLARKHCADVIIYQTFPSFNQKTPAIAFIHDVIFERFPNFFTWKEKLYFLPLKTLTRKANRLMVTSNSVANDLIRYGYTKGRDNVDLVPLGVNKDFRPIAEQSPQLMKALKEKYRLPFEFILYVGRLNARKNIDSLLKAIALLQHKKIPIVIVGKEDWKTTDLQQIIDSNSLAGRIIFTGEVSNSELVAIYAMAKIFCFPSYAEGFGLPPLEAMASGVPVIVSDANAISEICSDAATYIDPNEPATIANAIDDLLTNNEKYEEMKLKGIARAKQFSWQNTAIAFMNSIEKLSNYSQ